MSKHAARRRRSIRLPLAIACACACVVLASTMTGTLAFWSDDATVETGAISSGTLDITLDGNLAGAAANGGTWTQPALGLDDMLPGESKAVAVSVGNAGSTSLAYGVTGSASGALAPGLRFSIRAGATASNTGSKAAGNRAGVCAGGTALVTAATLTGQPATLVPTGRSLAAADAESVCVLVGLAADVGNELQGTTATARLTFTARQAGP